MKQMGSAGKLRVAGAVRPAASEPPHRPRGAVLTRGYVITGTDTDVGKTVVAAGLTRALGASYWKPIQAGLAAPTDSQTVAHLAGAGPHRIIPEAYRLTTACSPHEAARRDGVTIDPGMLPLPASERPLIVEGAGGMMVPINDTELMLDLFCLWNLPVIVVARTSLGTINHSLLSLLALRQRGLTLAGVLFVGKANPASERAIGQMGATTHLGRLPWLDPLTPETLALAFDQHIRLHLLA